MPASTGGRFGSRVPAAPMRHIDAKAISKDIQSKSMTDYLHAYRFLFGLILVMGLGLIIGRDYSFRIAILAAVALACVYTITLSLLRRMRER